MNVFLATILLLALSPQSTEPSAAPKVHDLLSQLRDSNTTEEAHTQLIAQARASDIARAEIATNLPEMLLSATSLKVIRSEADLAGTLKLELAIPALVTLLDRTNQSATQRTMTSYHELRDDPVGRALYEIGPPSLSYLAVSLESPKGYTRGRTVRILLLMNTDASRALLRKHYREEADPNLKALIGANVLEKPADPKE